MGGRQALFEAVQELGRVYQFRDANDVCSHGLTLTECYALEIIIDDGAPSVSRIAGRLGLNKSNACRAVDALVGKGLAKRRNHRSDRRVISVVATPAGKRRYGSIRRRVLARWSKVLSRFDADTLAAAAAVIREVAATVKLSR